MTRRPALNHRWRPPRRTAPDPETTAALAALRAAGLIPEWRITVLPDAGRVAMMAAAHLPIAQTVQPGRGRIGALAPDYRTPEPEPIGVMPQ